MQTSERANRPRWTGAKGFFEIWFLVVFHPTSRRAWWLRYTTLSPKWGGPARATVWAAAFDAGAPEPALALKSIVPIAPAMHSRPAGEPSEFDYRSDLRALDLRVGASRLTNGACSGRVRSGSHAMDWDLRFEMAEREALRAPWLLHQLPLATRGAHANSQVRFSGAITVDGVRCDLDRAVGCQYHIWGTRRVEELYWLYVPDFEEDARAHLEAMAIRPKRGQPSIAPAWLETAEERVDLCGLGPALLNRLESPKLGALRLEAASLTRAIRANAWCDPRTLVGYVYRDPAGWDVHVAQSDVGACEVEVLRRATPFGEWRLARRLTARVAAIELHGLEPLDGVRYLAWDDA